ncbi:nuclear mitotic apparatus protein 1-like [Selaginella moellendorffii]|uniref:nuclear mitotic apparatus protein 1-like n=1 Tax=Selaginella moellendorffii TaxID=88036 RepID=UPI000D1C5BD3|nr:nuclear mitotic apparatus protein 1-like [Selaginella moellendorffii]XP_024530738.1 nuclear mitotic apparatus protein 1-like [Selaginella moellendorffii]XP_024530739.1 nuclear mitotic apparatus protein 1-like [Selaginella moellendorffii]XP_024530740.1 nuclear mitotic apparatus protein 1-like [Selaginella moellendorffii]XP_024530741.1 nuclear mitotic apparatus protein 1-like [Selaginella moellendorffii]|eukprot:XP_024530737.1 nuclear mitotic apparatus protein 1-like [Selaginella moellendorffii]
MAGIGIGLGYRPRWRWSGAGCRSAGFGRAEVQQLDAVRIGTFSQQQQRRGLNSGNGGAGADAVLKQIEDIGIGLSQISRCRISGQNIQERVNRLVDRLDLLTKGVEQAMYGGRSVPPQLLAALNALQREQCSLANIIRLATASTSVVPYADEDEEVVAAELITDKSSEDVMNSLKRESALVPVTKPVYEMSAPVTKTATMASVRAEIERRVIQQLTARDVGMFNEEPLNFGQRPGAEDITGLDDGVKALKSEVQKAEVAEQQLRRLETALVQTVPLEVHESVIKKLQESLQETQSTVLQLTRELAEKENILSTVKKDLLKEQGEFVAKVSQLRGEIAERATNMEDLQLAVNDVVEEFSHGLQEIQKKAAVLAAELDNKEKLLNQLRKDWKAETRSLRKKLAKARKQMKELEEIRQAEQAELKEAKNRIVVLEDELTIVRKNYEEAEENRRRQKQESLARMKTLIAEMVKISRARSERELQVAELLKGASTEQTRRRKLLPAGGLPSSDKMKALQSFFSLMKDLLSRTKASDDK